jgi:hypothetical protein
LPPAPTKGRRRQAPPGATGATTDGLTPDPRDERAAYTYAAWAGHDPGALDTPDYWRERAAEILPTVADAVTIDTAARVLCAAYRAEAVAGHGDAVSSATALLAIAQVMDEARRVRDAEHGETDAERAVAIWIDRLAPDGAPAPAPAPDPFTGDQHATTARRSRSGRTMRTVRHRGAAQITGDTGAHAWRRSWRAALLAAHRATDASTASIVRWWADHLERQHAAHVARWSLVRRGAVAWVALDVERQARHWRGVPGVIGGADVAYAQVIPTAWDESSDCHELHDVYGVACHHSALDGVPVTRSRVAALMLDDRGGHRDAERRQASAHAMSWVGRDADGADMLGGAERVRLPSVKGRVSEGANRVRLASAYVKRDATARIDPDRVVIGHGKPRKRGQTAHVLRRQALSARTIDAVRADVPEQMGRPIAALKPGERLTFAIGAPLGASSADAGRWQGTVTRGKRGRWSGTARDGAGNRWKISGARSAAAVVAALDALD